MTLDNLFIVTVFHITPLIISSQHTLNDSTKEGCKPLIAILFPNRAHSVIDSPPVSNSGTLLQMALKSLFPASIRIQLTLVTESLHENLNKATSPRDLPRLSKTVNNSLCNSLLGQTAHAPPSTSQQMQVTLPPLMPPHGTYLVQQDDYIGLGVSTRVPGAALC